MKLFSVPTCPYCKKRVNLIRTWSLKRQGEYRCPRCGGISNIFLSPLVYVFALLAVFAGGAMYFFHKYVLDDIGLSTLVEVLLPFAVFFFVSLFLVYLERPVIKTVSRSTGKVRRLRPQREEPFEDVVQPRNSDTARVFADEDEYLPKMEYRTGVLPVSLRGVEIAGEQREPAALEENVPGNAGEQEEIYRRAQEEAQRRRQQAEQAQERERERLRAERARREAEEALRLRAEAEAAEQARLEAQEQERLRREQQAAEEARRKREAEEAARAQREAEKAERARRNAELAAQRELESAQNAQQRREAYEAKQEAERQARAQRQREAALAAQQRREAAEAKREAEQQARIQRQQEAARAAQQRREAAEQRRAEEEAERARRAAERSARQAQQQTAGPQQTAVQSSSWDVVRPRRHTEEDLVSAYQENMDSIDELLKQLQK